MQMIAHAIDREHFMLPGFHDAGNVFVQSCFPVRPDQRLPAFGCKNEMQMDLRIGVCHNIVVCKSV